ncbi:MAG: hypothetical protein JW984_06385 [Deltaproteobacteria bacterium]|uniref:Glycoside hydrolase family 38 central domain-containing protein n=1 Tax=Candidatus Zymogenus saltonus TaxID=2844893 RepID=A0A9D8PN52_9DELT|nr:hypothetical protein [Candidatus Zymogenus saltonus]
MTSSEREITLRKKLEIPDDAKRVLLFSESSHWDPNWMFTSKEYYKLRIRRLLDQAVKECEADPRRIFGIECIFFLKMYWERRPKRRESVRRLVNERRFRLTGSSTGTPDTCVPGLEAIIRDYLIGQEWLRENGMNQESRLAYLPDNFGVVPTLPTVLNALGYAYTALSRIDGCFYPGTDYADPRLFPRPGSSAELLRRDLKTDDFVWRGPDGSKLLCHWNPYTYGQGDTIAAAAPVRMMGVTFGFRARSIKKVAKKIESYVKDLAPLAKTPYMLCPMGLDFNGPVPGLLSLLDKYNREVYPESGIYVLNAGMDDYFDLVSCHIDKLPELEIDFNPYWTGFYSARPDVKQRCKKIVDDLLRIESALALAKDEKQASDLLRELAPVWETVVVANHHDFITGTSPDRVWKKEQRPWLVEAQKTIDRVKKEAKALHTAPAAAESPVKPPKVTASNGKIRIENKHYIITLSEKLGGCVDGWRDPKTGEELLTGLAGDVILYKDSGGLWRMGHEFAGGQFFMTECMSGRPAKLDMENQNGYLHVTSEFTLDGRAMKKEMWFSSDSPFVRMRLTGSARRWKTITCRFSSRLFPHSIYMDVPGGVVQRPLIKIYNPTYWAGAGFAHITDPKTKRGFALFMGGPVSVSGTANGALECVAIRNAPMERAYRIFPIPTAFPAYGLAGSEHSFNFAAGFTRKGDWRENRLFSVAADIIKDARIDPKEEEIPDAIGVAVDLDSEDVTVVALKRAHRGEGLIVRLQSFGPDRVKISLKDKKIKKAFLADARERDIEQLKVDSKGVLVPFTGTVATVRLLV